MKPTTPFAAAWRNVGDSKSELQTFEGNLQEFTQTLIPWLLAVSMAKRIQIEIGRDLPSIIPRFETARSAAQAERDSLMDEVMAMMAKDTAQPLAPTPDSPSPAPAPQWTPPTLKAPRP